MVRDDAGRLMSPDPIRQHRRVLSEQQLAEYRERGFLTVRQVIDADLLQRLIAVADRLWDEGQSLTAKTPHFDLAQGHSAEQPRIRRISSPTELEEVYLAAAFDSVLGAIAADLVGGAVKFYHSKINFKMPAGGSDAMRTTYIIQYAAADAFAYTAPVIDSRHRNRMVRGEPARYARLEAGMVELPPDFSAGYSSIYSLQEPGKSS